MDINLNVTRELFQFQSKQDWINSAQHLFANCGVPRHRYISIDAAGRIVTCGADFTRAEEDDSFPVSVYEI